MAGDTPSIFEQLSASDSSNGRDAGVQTPVEVIDSKAAAQEAVLEVLTSNSTLPCTVSSVSVTGTKHTRHGFLARVFKPILDAQEDGPQTLSSVLREVSAATSRLQKFDIFQEPISLYIDRPSRGDPNSTPTDLDVYLSVVEKPRVTFRSGADVGNAEGSASASLSLRNALGGAEALNVNASLGTRTKSAYQGTFDTPLLSNPNLRVQVGGITSSIQNLWASHDEKLRHGWANLRYASGAYQQHELGIGAAWRQITNLGPDASPTVRNDAGDSVKNSLTYTWTLDCRNNRLLPSSGVYLKTAYELAGWGPLRGDVAFWKSEYEAQAAIPIPLPRIKNSGISFTTGLRAGFLYPLSLSTASQPLPSRINDRFQRGGPTDVRGFRLSGLGPRDGTDAVGGDIYAAGSANLLLPLPYVGPDHPLRIQLFANAGRLLALQKNEKEGRRDNASVQRKLISTFKELVDGFPSTAAGIGLVYAHPLARFELNFSLPLLLRKGEDARKGLQVGIGINFL